MSVIEGKMWREALLVFGRMSGWVATPVVLALLAGRFLDSKFESGNMWFIVLIGVGFFVSIFGIYRESKKYQRTLEKNNKEIKN